MKTYISGILFVAGFALFGFIATSQFVSAAAVCMVQHSDGTTSVVQDGQCYGDKLCSNGTICQPGSCTAGCAISAGGSGTGGVGSSAGAVLNTNTTYYWRVKAGNAFGQSGWSNVFNFKTAATATSGVSATSKSPAIVGSGSASSVDNFYSLLASFGTWTNASGSVVTPKSVSQVLIYQDENGQRVYPRVNPSFLINYFENIVKGGTAATFPACGSGSVNTTYQGFRCCKDGSNYSWFTGWTGTASQCAGATVGTTSQTSAQ